MSATESANRPSANAEHWGESQEYELKFWKERWPYRHHEVSALQELRRGDAKWFLTNLGFTQTGPDSFEGFTGTVLEVGAGPIGFFELAEGIECTANDSLMEAYARELPYSTLGKRGSTTYVREGLAEISGQFRFVVCSNVLDHTGDWMEFLELLTQRVAPGGELLLMTDSRGIPIEGHTQIFTPEQLFRAVRWLGFRHVKCSNVIKINRRHCDATVFLRASRV